MKTMKALRKCADFLAFCLSTGWSRDMLDKLEELWWQYHDNQGNLLMP